MSDEIDVYINNIARELEDSHDKWFDSFGFPIFGETSKEYHEQVYFQSYLESYTRKLINGILKKMFEAQGRSNFSWPEFEYYGVYNGYTNKEYEESFRFEFIDTEEKTGYRYCVVNLDEIDSLLADEKVEKVKRIIWEEAETIGFDYEDPRIEVLSLADFFYSCFNSSESEEGDIFHLFVSNISEAVTRANSMISLVSLPGFTSQYIYKSKDEVRKNFVDKICDLTLFNVMSENHKDIERDSTYLIKDYKLSKYFLDNHFEEAFLGRSHFAKSFLTSEYLFRYFKSNPMFDYTPIVSGYIKSIEQILHGICVSYRNQKNIHKEMRDFTFGKYTDFIKTHDDIIREEIRPVKDIIHKCLDSYRIENRNHLFHKDYFSDWKRVDIIRSNTFFIYIMLFGAVSIEILKSDDNFLGLIKDDYNKLFQILDSVKSSYFTIVIDGKELVGMEKEQRKQGLSFSKYGVIQNKVLFSALDHDHYKTIEISARNIPSEIWLSDAKGSKTRRIW